MSVKKQKSPLLLLHGWAMTPAVWQPLRAALDAEAFDTQAPALPGHDGHEHAARPDATLDAWAEIFAPQMGAPVFAPQVGAPVWAGTRPAPTPLAPTTVVGWSLGALIALELARLYPERVARLILIGATPRFAAAPDWPHGLDAGTVAAFGEDYTHQTAACLRRFLTLQSLGEKTARRSLLSRLETACVPHPEGRPLPALADGLKILSGSDLRPRLVTIGQPVHLIHGDGDTLMPLAAARWLAAALPNARLSVLEGCGHALPLSHPVELAQLISVFA